MRAQPLLAALQVDDFARLADAVDAAARRIHARELDDAELAAVSERLLALADHSKWEVRKAVAQALRYVRHDSVASVIAKLVDDPHGYVARAAKHTSELRTEQAQLGILPMALDGRMQKLLDALETKHNRKARDAAIRVGLAYTEFMIRSLHHQAAAAMMPVGVLLETLEVLLESGGPPEARAIVRDARANLHHVNQVLSHARDFVKRDPPEYRRTLLAPVIARALATVQSLPVARQNAVATNVDVEDALALEAVESLLEEALVNVMKNAVEASSERRPIRLHVRARRVKGSVEVSVRDEGCGMSEDERARDIWRAYGSKKPGGTGLGLPLVRKIVEFEHRGRVDVASKRGEGTTVTFTLPVQQEF